MLTNSSQALRRSLTGTRRGAFREQRRVAAPLAYLVTELPSPLYRRLYSSRCTRQFDAIRCRKHRMTTVAEVDCLVSWNFKHIVNERRNAICNSVNVVQNYQSLDICTPREIKYDE